MIAPYEYFATNLECNEFYLVGVLHSSGTYYLVYGFNCVSVFFYRIFCWVYFVEIANILLGKSGGMPPTPTSNQQIEQLP